MSDPKKTMTGNDLWFFLSESGVDENFTAFPAMDSEEVRQRIDRIKAIKNIGVSPAEIKAAMLLWPDADDDELIAFLTLYRKAVEWLLKHYRPKCFLMPFMRGLREQMEKEKMTETERKQYADFNREWDTHGRAGDALKEMRRRESVARATGPKVSFKDE